MCFAKGVAICALLSAVPHLEATVVIELFSKGGLRRLASGPCRKMGSSKNPENLCLLLSDVFKELLYMLSQFLGKT